MIDITPSFYDAWGAGYFGNSAIGGLWVCRGNLRSDCWGCAYRMACPWLCVAGNVAGKRMCEVCAAAYLTQDDFDNVGSDCLDDVASLGPLNDTQVSLLRACIALTDVLQQAGTWAYQAEMAAEQRAQDAEDKARADDWSTSRYYDGGNWA